MSSILRSLLRVATALLVTSLIPGLLGAAEPRRGYILRLDDLPVASFRGEQLDAGGRKRRFEATSPASTGDSRIDLQSKAVREYRDHLASRRLDLRARAAQWLGRPLDVGFEYEFALHGLSLSLTETEARRLRKLEGVAAVELESVSKPQTDAGPQWIGADQLWTGETAGRGEGVVVGVIDTGVNAGHPAFAAQSALDGYLHVNPRGTQYGLCATGAGQCNGKLIGIHDFTLCTGNHASSGCDDREANTGIDVDGHGSHVASTVLGNPVNLSIGLASGAVNRRVSGVAPRAHLIMYKACEQEENCRGSWLLAAIEQAIIDGVQVLNYSIGGDSRNPWSDSAALAMLAARDAGVVVVVSAGNSGPDPATMTSPADAPWVLAVANSSHDRVIDNLLLDLQGGATPPPQGGVLLGSGNTVGYGPAPLVIPTDAPLCSIGSELDSPPDGRSNPWQPGRFSGEIVVCLRGVQARVAKSNNVRLAGGGGMVLLNQPADGESTVADAHSLPATHVGAEAAAALLQWLGSGSGHRGRIEGAQLRSDPLRGDRLAASSSRGPVAWGGYLKPDLSAPGSSILAAAATGSGGAFLTGTSMAAPHVAGAAALLRGLHRQWSVADVESALRSTSTDTIMVEDQPASPNEQGSGRVAPAAAHRVGLAFALDGAALRASNPSEGGSPTALNLPSIAHPDCFERCSFQRTVSDRLGGGRWRVETQAEAGMLIEVSPSEFTLTAGGQQTLQIAVDVRAAQLLGRYAVGRIVLRAVDATGTPLAAVSAAELPVAVYSNPGLLPTQFEATVDGDRGRVDFSIDDLLALSDLRVDSSELIQPVASTSMLVEDPTRADPYDAFAAGTQVEWLALPGNAQPFAFRFDAEVRSAAARDVDLYVGLDADGDNQPDQDEELCRSATAGSSERCSLDLVSGSSARRYWILVQSYAASAPGVADAVQLQHALIPMDATNGTELVVTAPAKTARLGAFNLRFVFDDATFVPGEQRWAYVTLYAGGSDQALGRVPLRLQRAAAGANAERVLGPGEQFRVRLAAGAASDRLVIDVPANATELRVQSAGSGEVDLYLSRIETPAGPAIAVAPARAAAVASARNPGANEDLRLGLAQGLRAGRWYITPVNAGTQAAEFDLRVDLQTATALPSPRPGAYFNPQRSGAGVFVFPGGGNLSLLWYTYLEDGTPSWYIAAAPVPAAEQGIWTAPLYRARWNGSAAPLTQVGSVVISKLSAGEFQFGWNLDGRSGSESYQYIDGGGCAQQAGSSFDIDGFWFNPAQPGFGYSVNAFPAIETNGAYFYDEAGIARWALGSVAPFGGDTLNYDLRLGACPSCNYVEPTVIAGIGQLVRSYSSTEAGRMRLDLTLPAPLAGRWQVDTPVAKLTSPTGCQ